MKKPKRHAINPRVYAKYYELVYGRTLNDVPFYTGMASQTGGPVLELACGTGRVLLPIAQARFECWGVDFELSMLGKLRAKLRAEPEEVRRRLNLVQADMRDFDLPRRFSLAFVAFNSFLALTTTEDQEKCLHCIRRHMKSDGLMVINVFAPRHDLLAQTEAGRICQEISLPGDEGLLRVEEHVERDLANEVMYVENTFTTLRGRHKVKTEHSGFTLTWIHRRELLLLLANNGFEVAAFYGDFDRRPYDYQSGKMIVVARKAPVRHGR
ncbi:class I SAM-dependent methyltransferase [PVC group bacterium]|nr:class I SAM-dependent methyltransferase [PVC group bacterium]